MSILIIDAQNGCSGDMFVAALSQLADCQNDLDSIPEKLGLSHVKLNWSDVTRSSIAAKKFDVLVQHDHSHEHAHSHEHKHKHEHEHEHDHQHQHTHADHHHDHEHRHLSDIKSLINAAELSDGCKQRAIDMFQRLGAVEAQAHGIDIEAVHFHEVGAIDSIIDIISVAYCLDKLNPSAAYCSAICTGFGQVKTAHGILPIPAPATERLLQGFACITGELSGEWCTPTGAVVIAHLQCQQDIPAHIGMQSAYGAGGKDPETRPNALRIRLAKTQQGTTGEQISILQCNVDDMPAELLGTDFIQAALSAGAKDVSIRQQIMKKGRPGQLIEILCAIKDKQKLAEFLCTHTTTIGVRIIEAERYILDRRSEAIATSFGEIQVKFVQLPDGNERGLPEYEDCAARAREHQCSTLSVYQKVLAEINN